VIGSIRGRVLERNPASLTVEVGGIGLLVFVSERTATAAEASEIQLFTYLHVRDNALELYGFASAKERAIFRALLGVSGIGPRTSMALLSRLTDEEIVSAIQHRNVATLCLAPGVGKKTAQRILLELSERFEMTAPGVTGADVAAAQDAIQALITLGYPEGQAAKTVSEARSRLPDGAGAPELIREAIRMLSARR
jgi:Holliday junction DNA helicase RuvA